MTYGIKKLREDYDRNKTKNLKLSPQCVYTQKTHDVIFKEVDHKILRMNVNLAYAVLADSYDYGELSYLRIKRLFGVLFSPVKTMSYVYNNTIHRQFDSHARERLVITSAQLLPLNATSNRFYFYHNARIDATTIISEQVVFILRAASQLHASRRSLE